MKIEFEHNEEETLKEMCKLISKNMGVTLKDDYLTVRFGQSRKRFKSVSLKIMGIDTGDYDTCYICETVGHHFNKSKARIDTSNNEEYVRSVKICPDCYCSK